MGVTLASFQSGGTSPEVHAVCQIRYFSYNNISALVESLNCCHYDTETIIVRLIIVQR